MLIVRPPVRVCAAGRVPRTLPPRVLENEVVRCHRGAVGQVTIDEVLAEHGAVVAFLFGSRTTGVARPDSDHDVAVLFDASPPLGATERLAADLVQVLGTPVDVVDLDAATLELRGRVAESGTLLHSADEPRRVRFLVDARNRWIEFRPMLEETTRGFLARVAREGLR